MRKDVVPAVDIRIHKLLLMDKKELTEGKLTVPFAIFRVRLKDTLINAQCSYWIRHDRPP